MEVRSVRKPIVLDLETKYSFRETDNDILRLGVACVGIYDYLTKQFKAYLEDELQQLFPLLERASFIVGFNIDRFDFIVLDNYYIGKLTSLSTVDLLEIIKKASGKRIPLDELARETLGVTKSGHGLQAIEHYRAGRIEELKRYCLDDVKITRDLYEYGRREGKLFYRGLRRRETILVDWNQSIDNKSDVNLSLGI